MSFAADDALLECRCFRGLCNIRVGEHATIGSMISLRLFKAPHWCYWYLNRKTVHPLCRIRISAKMGGLPSSTGQLPSAADGSRIDATPTAREESSHLTGCPPGIMGEEGK